VSQSHDSPAAIVFLPPLRGRLADRALQRWLSRGQLDDIGAPAEPLAEVLRALGRQRPEQGLGALRMWGQTGDRPGTWIAAADPVYMEPRLDRLFLHALDTDDVSRSELRSLFDALQAILGEDGALGFARLGGCGYIRSQYPMVTPAVPATLLDGQNPAAALPSAAALGLISEIEMALHELPANVERQARGQPPVNSLWVWGGGYAPQPRTVGVPPLYSGEPLLRGYWASVAGQAGEWPGTIAACLDAAPGGFVATVPHVQDVDAAPEADLAAVRDALRSGRLNRAVLISADGIRVLLRRSDRLRVWRRVAPLLEGPAA